MFEVSTKILCVDDSPDILALLEGQLAGRYQVRFAASGAEALSLLASEAPIAVVMTDFTMPGMDGIALLKEIRARSADTVNLMLTAHADVSVAVSALHEGHIFRFVRKPWDVNLLCRYLDDALEQYRVVVTEQNLSAALEQSNRKLFEKVQQLEAAYRLLARWVQFSPAVIYSASFSDDEPRLSYISPNIANLTGHHSQTFTEQADFWRTHVHPEDLQRVLDKMAGAEADDAKVQTCEYRFRHRDGNYRWVRDTFRKVMGADQAIQIIGAWTDISDLVALREQIAGENTDPFLKT
jgi:PAS domain S-box-containing protein